MFIQIETHIDLGKYFVMFFEKFSVFSFSRPNEKTEITCACVNPDITCDGMISVDDYFDGLEFWEIGQILGGN